MSATTTCADTMTIKQQSWHGPRKIASVVVPCGANGVVGLHRGHRSCRRVRELIVARRGLGTSVRFGGVTRSPRPRPPAINLARRAVLGLGRRRSLETISPSRGGSSSFAAGETGHRYRWSVIRLRNRYYPSRDRPIKVGGTKAWDGLAKQQCTAYDFGQTTVPRAGCGRLVCRCPLPLSITVPLLPTTVPSSTRFEGTVNNSYSRWERQS